MAATVSVSANPKVGVPTTVTVAGASNNTAYVLRIAHPGGGTETHNVTTNGSGGVSVTYVPQDHGTATITLDPAPTSSGTTASTTANHGS